MKSSSADRNPVEQLAEEFAERHRRGERPSLTDQDWCQLALPLALHLN